MFILNIQQQSHHYIQDLGFYPFDMNLSRNSYVFTTTEKPWQPYSFTFIKSYAVFPMPIEDVNGNKDYEFYEHGYDSFDGWTWDDSTKTYYRTGVPVFGPGNELSLSGGIPSAYVITNENSKPLAFLDTDWEFRRAVPEPGYYVTISSNYLDEEKLAIILLDPENPRLKGKVIVYTMIDPYSKMVGFEIDPSHFARGNNDAPGSVPAFTMQWMDEITSNVYVYNSSTNQFDNKGDESILSEQGYNLSWRISYDETHGTLFRVQEGETISKTLEMNFIYWN
jgi:hypothetical protein